MIVDIYGVAKHRIIQVLSTILNSTLHLTIRTIAYSVRLTNHRFPYRRQLFETNHIIHNNVFNTGEKCKKKNPHTNTISKKLLVHA